ncbi:MAG: helix-turn-helix transcriptional regulator [Clostridiales bacterium]|nr:helix-turn-helix transcriptional regulator [Clostridiales bacterium]
MARKQFQTLSEPMFYILLCLTEPLHGYAVMQRIEELTAGRVAVGPGTLYALVSRFEKEGIVSRIPSDEGKKVYCITEKGKQLLDDELDRLKNMINDSSSVLRG